MKVCFGLFQFLVDELLDFRSLKESALERAAQITPLVTSITIGPNSSYRTHDDSDEEPTKDTGPAKFSKKLERLAPFNKSPVTTSDLRAMQQKIQWQNEERKLKEDVRKKMEERIQCEQEHYKRVQAMLDTMRIEAERKQRIKVEQLGRQIENALKIEEQNEMVYQEQRKELTKNRRKILEQQEKDLRDSLKKYEDMFNQIETNFNIIAQSCNPEMTQIVEAHKKQFDLLLAYKNSNKSSIDGIKNVCIKSDELCRSLSKAYKEFEVLLKAQQVQREAEEKQALAQAQAEQSKAFALAEAQKVEEIARAQHAAEAVQVPQRALKPSQNTECGQMFYSSVKFLNEKQNSTRQLTEAREMETLRFALKLAVNKPINHLNEENKSSLIDALQALQSLLAGQRITTTKGAISITDHPQASDWTKLRIAEKLIVRKIRYSALQLNILTLFRTRAIRRK